MAQKQGYILGRYECIFLFVQIYPISFGINAFIPAIYAETKEAPSTLRRMAVDDRSLRPPGTPVVVTRPSGLFSGPRRPCCFPLAGRLSLIGGRRNAGGKDALGGLQDARHRVRRAAGSGMPCAHGCRRNEATSVAGRQEASRWPVKGCPVRVPPRLDTSLRLAGEAVAHCHSGPRPTSAL